MKRGILMKRTIKFEIQTGSLELKYALNLSISESPTMLTVEIAERLLHGEFVALVNLIANAYETRRDIMVLDEISEYKSEFPHSKYSIKSLFSLLSKLEDLKCAQESTKETQN